MRYSLSSSVGGNSEVVLPPPPPPPPSLCTRGRRFWLFVGFLTAIAATAAVVAATAACVLNFRKEATGRGGSSRNSISSSYSSSNGAPQIKQGFVFDAPDGPSAPGVGHSHDHQQQQQFQQRERRPLCAESDDPEYSCFIRRPPGSFEDEIAVYLSMSPAVVAAAGGDGKHQQQQSLSVKIVVPAAGSSRQGIGGHNGGGTGWASLGFSPNGKMAGPSEGVVGFVGAATVAGDGVEGVCVPVLFIGVGLVHCVRRSAGMYCCVFRRPGRHVCRRCVFFLWPVTPVCALVLLGGWESFWRGPGGGHKHSDMHA